MSRYARHQPPGALGASFMLFQPDYTQQSLYDLWAGLDRASTRRHCRCTAWWSNGGLWGVVGYGRDGVKFAFFSGNVRAFGNQLGKGCEREVYFICIIIIDINYGNKRYFCLYIE